METRFALLLATGAKGESRTMTAWIERGVVVVAELLEATPDVVTGGPAGTVTIITGTVESARLRDVAPLRGIREFIREFGAATYQREVGVIVGDDYLGICEFGNAS